MNNSRGKGGVMAQPRMALCDGNIHYGRKLTDYLAHQKAFPYEVVHFSDWDQFAAYRKSGKAHEAITHLIISEDMLADMPSDTGVAKTFLLTTEDGVQKGSGQDGICRIYRYQPAGYIMRSLLSNLEEERIDAGRCLQKKHGTQIIGVYTPVKRSMQTSFCILLGQVLAKKKRTLYLNMECFSGFRALLGRELKPDITDFLYYAEHDSRRFMARLEQMMDRIGELEYLPPASTWIDLMSVSKEQWLKLLQELDTDGRFGYVILDLTEQVQGLFSVLEKCDRVYMLESDDCVARAKIYEYEQMLHRMELDVILEKTKRQKLPVLKRTDIDFYMLPYSELAEYVRKLAAEEYGDD